MAENILARQLRMGQDGAYNALSGLAGQYAEYLRGKGGELAQGYFPKNALLGGI